MQQDILYDNVTAASPLHSNFRRPRVDKLLEEAIAFPLVLVTAGAGYGKTQAVSAFLDSHQDIAPIWLRLSRLDNFSTRFWESFVCAVKARNPELASDIYTMGFPNSAPLFHLFLHKLSDVFGSMEKPVLIFDDFHTITEPLIVRFIESLLNARLKNLSVILVGRTEPHLELQGYYTENLVYQITEADLCFTPEETKDYFRAHGIALQNDDFYKIYSGTQGWISAIYLVLLSLKKNDSAASHALAAAKPKIFELIEREIFTAHSSEVQRILIKLSFLESASIDVKIIKALSNHTANLMEEIEKNNRFIQFDPPTQSYRIHHLFLEFLFHKQRYCTQKEIEDVHYLAAQWHREQGAVIDALGHYRKCGHYEEIWDIMRHYDIDIPQEEAALLLDLIEEFPEAFLKEHPLIGVVQGRLFLNNGRLEDAVSKLSKIKETYEALPPDPENKAVLGEACVFLAMLSLAMRNYDFVELFKTADRCLPGGSVFVDNRLYLNNGNYSVAIENPAAGELEKFENAVICAMPYAAKAMSGCCCGAEYLTLAESAYYTNDMVKAESNAYETIYKARGQRQNDLVCIAYFTLIRAGIAKGNYLKAAGLLEELQKTVEKRSSTDCLSIIDNIEGWFYARLGDMDRVPDWIMAGEQNPGTLSPNRMGRDRLLRAYCLLQNGNYHELFAFTKYLEELYIRQGFLIPKIHAQIFQSIAAQKIHDTQQSVTALRAAYELAHANSLIMPFVEMGKYMRAVCDEARRYQAPNIPEEWLSRVYAKASTYAKHLHDVQAQYKNSTGYTEKKPYALTGRESEILQYLCQGLTRKEIADLLYLSTSTVKRTLKNIYGKMGAANSAEAVKLAVQSGLDGGISTTRERRAAGGSDVS